jgi:N-methylhydantoinase A
MAEPAAPVSEPAPAAAPVATRHLAVRETTTGEVRDWPVYERAAFSPGASISGPAIVAEAETSTLVGPGWRCGMDGQGTLELLREAA